MNKKLIAVLICLVMLSAVMLSACGNKFKQNPVSVDGVSNDTVAEGNYGRAVKLGKYLYFVNGVVSVDVDNTFGKPEKSAIWRVTLADDGSIISDSRVRIVPKNVLDSSSKPSIYIYKGWIYYATPNLELTTAGEPNTTRLDFMRTTIDGAKTEVITTITSRSANYMFANGYLVYNLNNALYSVDCESKKTTTIIDKNLSTTLFVMDEDGGAFAGYVLYLKTPSDDVQYKNYNELVAVSADGKTSKTVLTDTSYTSYLADTKNIFQFGLLDYKVEADGLTLFYTKANVLGGSSTQTAGTYCYKFRSADFAFDAAKEAHLSNTALSGIIPISYSEGVLVTGTNVVYQYKAAQNVVAKTVLEGSFKVCFVLDGKVYYSESSSPKNLYAFELAKVGTGAVAEKIFKAESIGTTGITMEVVDGYVYYVDGGTYKYLYRASLSGSDVELVGKMTAEDVKAIEDAKNK